MLLSLMVLVLSWTFGTYSDSGIILLKPYCVGKSAWLRMYTVCYNLYYKYYDQALKNADVKFLWVF